MTFVRVILYTILWLRVESKTVDLLGAGASFPNAVYSQWMHLYRLHRVEHADVRMTYDSVGSGNGKELIKEDMVHFAGSDVPLSEQEKEEYPDLNVIPTLAGAIVMAFNIPNVKQLNLSLEAIVGIYNGTIRQWSDKILVNLNPETTLPLKEIVVVARGEKAGSTGIFTSCLSSYSEDWRTAYGSFTVGRDSQTREPIKWNKDTVKFFGETNLGMMGLITSIDYSIGYVAVAHASSSNMNYAKIRNSAGNLLNASPHTVQNAILSSNGSYDIVNTPGKFAYPFASFTYFIIKMSTMGECDGAVEFVRYIRWFYTSERAQEVAIRLNMVPLDNGTGSFIMTNVLQRMTCRGKNIWEMMIEQIEKENMEVNGKIWLMPLLICLSLLVAFITGLLVHLGRQQILLHRELMKETWKINRALISFNTNSSREKTKTENRSGSPHREDLSEGFVFTDDLWACCRFRVGAYNENPVTLIRMRKQSSEFTMAEKKSLIWMRDSIKHSNVLQLLGVTELNGHWSFLHAEFIRGSLSDMLHSERIEISTEGVVALSKSLLKGLIYLHKKGIVHGRLTGMCCLIDASWEVKISDWIETYLGLSKKMERNKVSSLQEESEEDLKSMLWVAPEILKFKRMPTQASDIYSLSMIFQEMFTKQEPYFEFTMTDSEIIHAILTCGIRPKLATETPGVFKSIIEMSWETDPAARPRLEIIYNSIKAAFPSDVSFLDCMIRSIELYAKHLEGKMKDQELVIRNLDEKLSSCVYQSVPRFVASSLIAKAKVETEIKDNICIMVCRITSISSVIKHVTGKGIVNLLNNFYSGVDQLLLKDDIYRLNRYATESIFVIGLERRGSNRYEKKVSVDATLIALKLNSFVEKFNKERLIGINTDLKLQTGLASGTIAVGIIGNMVPQYTAFGDVTEHASELARKALPGEIRISENMSAELDGESSIEICTRNIKGDECYTLFQTQRQVLPIKATEDTVTRGVRTEGVSPTLLRKL